MTDKLLPSERPITMARQHWVTLVPSIAMSLAILIGGMVVLSKIPNTFQGFDVGNIKGLLALVIVLGAFVAGFITWLQRYYQTYILTDHRIVESRGILSRVTESINLDRIQDSVVRQGITGRIIGFGNIEIESAGKGGVEVLYNIPHVQEFGSQLLQAIESHRELQVFTPPASTASQYPQNYSQQYPPNLRVYPPNQQPINEPPPEAEANQSQPYPGYQRPPWVPPDSPPQFPPPSRTSNRGGL